MVLSEAEGLLRIAIADLETAMASSDPAVFREGAWGFWLQQSVEKALKAWLVHLGEIPPLTHDLNRLLRLLERRQMDTKTLQPLGLDRVTFHSQVRQLLEAVQGVLRKDAI